MTGRPASLYQELIQKIRGCADRISTLPSAVSTSNLLLSVQLSSLRDSLGTSRTRTQTYTRVLQNNPASCCVPGRQLRSMEDELLQHLAEQIQLRSESLTGALEEATAQLQTQPQDLKYALMVKKHFEAHAGLKH